MNTNTYTNNNNNNNNDDNKLLIKNVNMDDTSINDINNSTDNINVDKVKKKKKIVILKGEATVKRLTDGHNVVDLDKLENIIKEEGVRFENTGIKLTNVKGDTLITTKPFDFILDIAKPLLYVVYDKDMKQFTVTIVGIQLIKDLQLEVDINNMKYKMNAQLEHKIITNIKND